MVGKRISDANEDLSFARATRLGRFDASSSGQNTIRSNAFPPRKFLADSALRGVLFDGTLSVGPLRVFESPDKPFGDGLAVPSVSVNGSSNNCDIDDELFAPSKGTVRPATSRTDVSRQSIADDSDDTRFTREFNCDETRNGGGDCTAERTEANVLDSDYMLAAKMDVLQRRGGISYTRGNLCFKSRAQKQSLGTQSA
jgi:hypothetical protein